MATHEFECMMDEDKTPVPIDFAGLFLASCTVEFDTEPVEHVVDHEPQGHGIYHEVLAAFDEAVPGSFTATQVCVTDGPDYEMFEVWNTGDEITPMFAAAIEAARHHAEDMIYAINERLE